MESFKFSKLDDATLKKLYVDFGFRARAIGRFVGLTESSILLKLKKLNIPSNPRDKKSIDINVEYTGESFAKRRDLTGDLLRDLCNKGLTDEDIGKQFSLSGEGIAYRRKKLGITMEDKQTPLKNNIENLHRTSEEILYEDYYSMTTEEFSSKYKLSKTVWLPYLRSIGLISKYEQRINSFPALTIEQKRLIIASMLGDGGITEEGCFYEFHSNKQFQYLQFKHRILKPFSKDIKNGPDGSWFETVNHPVFKNYRDNFYRKDVDGKLMPLDIIAELWDDSMLAYWFFDDGNYDDSGDTASFANFCPFKDQLISLVDFLNKKYSWAFSISGEKIYKVFIPKQHILEFGNLLMRFATPDLYYKIPEECLTSSMISEVKIDDVHLIRPKFYRVCNNLKLKLQMEETVFKYYRARGFPYMNLLEPQQIYTLNSFMKTNPKCVEGSIAHNVIGLKLCEKFFPNIYSCNRKGHRPPIELWENDEYLKRLVKNRLLHADIISDSSMRTGIKLTKACVSNFKPIVAKYLYQEYCHNGKILDYACGFGSRMLAALSLNMEYSGFEPSEKTYQGLQNFGAFLTKNIGGKFDIRKKGSEEEVFKNNYFGFAFSSPPYFDFETYSQDEKQSFIKFPNYEDWLRGYWFKTMQNCFHSLIAEGFFGVCLSSAYLGNILDVTFDYAKEIGFYFHKDYTVPFKHVLSGIEKSETILIFSKKDTGAQPVFYGQTKPIKKLTPIIKDELMEVSGIKKTFYRDSEIDAAVSEFKKVAHIKGLSREIYRDGSLGVPSHVLEHHFGTWNKFLVHCGLTPQYTAQNPREHIEQYLDTCKNKNKVLSFYEYEYVTNKPCTRLKRLFNKGKPYHGLLDELKQVALHPDKWPEFLKKFC